MHLMRRSIGSHGKVRTRAALLNGSFDPERRLPMEKLLELAQHVLSAAATALLVAERVLGLRDRYRRWRMDRERRDRG